MDTVWEWLWLLIRVAVLYWIARSIQLYFQGVAETLKKIAEELKKANTINSIKDETRSYMR